MTYMESEKKMYRQSYLQSRNRDTDRENKPSGENRWDELGIWESTGLEKASFHSNPKER